MGTGETVAVKQVKLADLPKSELRVITVCIQRSSIRPFANTEFYVHSLRSTFSRT